MEVSNNEGVVVGGSGMLEATNIAAGKGASIHNNYNAPEQAMTKEDVLTRLTALEQMIQEHRAQLPDSEDVTAAVENVRTELEKEQPSRLSVIGILNSVAEGVKSVTGIATAAQVLKQAVDLLYGIK